MNIKSPIFIVFEGIDGAGKSTQAEMLYHFCRQYAPAVMLREPTDSIWGQSIRKILKGQKTAPHEDILELFIKDREYDVANNIIPSLQDGRVVIMDRYFYSNAAYQANDTLMPKDIIALNINKGFPIPDRTYFIDIEPIIALERIRKRSNDAPEIFEKLGVLQKIRRNYQIIIDESFAVIPADNHPAGVIFNKVKDDFFKNFSEHQ